MATRHVTVWHISIHALHEESDSDFCAIIMLPLFQSTLSMRRATTLDLVFDAGRLISIHALHEESDPLHAVEGSVRFHISIHALHEESDPVVMHPAHATRIFQSTLSMRRATIHA